MSRWFGLPPVAHGERDQGPGHASKLRFAAKSTWHRSAIGCLAILLASLFAWGLRAGKDEKGSGVQQLIRDVTTCCSDDEFRRFRLSNQVQADATKSIEAMLSDSADAAHWYKAVVALGTVAPYEDETVQRLWGFLISGKTFASCLALSHHEVADRDENASRASSSNKLAIGRELARAKVEVPIAIGLLLARSGNQPKQVHKLIGASDPKFWAKSVQWSAPSLFDGDDEMDVVLASQSVRGLSLSGQDKAVEFILGTLHTNPPTKDERFLDAANAAFCAIKKCQP